MTQNQTTTLITGASRGIGLELVKQARSRGQRVIAVVRKASEGLRALAQQDGEIEIHEGVDVADAAAPAAIASLVGGRRLDVLLHCAGVLAADTAGQVDAAKLHQQLVVNAAAPVLVTEALLGALGQGSKLVVITSRMGSVSDNTSGGYYGYRMSKAAVNAAWKSFAIDLAPKGVAVAMLHPGFVRTEMTGGQGMIDADESARLLWERIDALSAATTGQFLHASGEILPF